MIGRRPAHRATVGALAAVAMVLVLAGCGVPVDRDPAALPRRDIPFGLLQPSTASTTTTTPGSSPVETPVLIFLVGTNGHLVAVGRQVRLAQESLGTVLEALLKGPTNIEAAAGLQSAVPIRTVILGATLATGGVATVNLGGTFGQLVGQAQIQAVAQIVYTATALPGVTGVTFELMGKPAKVPVASGAEVVLATPGQFTALAPPPTVPS